VVMALLSVLPAASAETHLCPAIFQRLINGEHPLGRTTMLCFHWLRIGNAIQKTVHISLLMLCVVLNAIPCLADVQTNHAAAFREYLSNPPDIKRVIYSKPGQYFHVGDKTLTNDVWFEAAYQGASFYNRILDSRSGIDITNHPFAGRISGQSGSHSWRVSKQMWDRHLVEAAPFTEEAAESPPAKAAASAKQDLRIVRTLGVQHLDAGQLRWINDTDFEGHSTQYGKVWGSLSLAADGGPAKLSYFVESQPGRTYSVSYTNFNPVARGTLLPRGCPESLNRD